jgi:RNA polymerase sigma factor (sigma-70 family)
MNSPTVHLVDDDTSLLRGLSRMLVAAGYAVRTFDSAADFLAWHGMPYRGCVVADLQMPDMNGLELQAELAHGGNPLPFVFLTGYGDISTCVNAMQQGAEDFLTKPVSLEKLVPAVERAMARDAANFERISHREKLLRLFKRLTPREREVLDHVLAGKLNKEIAADLGTSERTIKAHRASIMDKLQAHSPAELGSIAHEAGIGGAASGISIPH